ncbi:hypothetical protein MLD38_023654 [Melastoma candidum]|uniref:Uncharacterized protein n=1 Tax=Melastoma candidum TaxID=119954 RepID=A0ACB9NQC0_9MYRT|nr:hypothetical protein MLD38_023654 [Melastoma candidum]
MERLSTLYNADVGLYMLANKWMVNENELRVIHYTLGPLKPWDWWTSWLLKPVDVWQTVRDQLDDALPWTGGGSNPKTNFLVKFLFILPICIVLLGSTNHFCRCSGTYAYSNVSASSVANFNQQFPNGAHMKVPGYLGSLSIVVCFVAACVAFLIAIAIIPRQVRPWSGLFLMYEWTFTIFYALFRGYLAVVYKIGRAAAIQLGANSSRESSEYDSGKGHQRHNLNFDLSSWFYWLGMAVLAIVAPALPCFFGITALFARLGLMVGGGIVLASFMTYASEHLALRYFIWGFEDRDSVRGRSMCSLC